MLNSQEKELSKITKQVNHTLEISDVLAGRKPIGGKIGAKLQKQQADQLDIKKGKAARAKNFKQFDDFCERLETIVNGQNDKSQQRIKIERANIVNAKNPGKLI